MFYFGHERDQQRAAPKTPGAAPHKWNIW